MNDDNWLFCLYSEQFFSGCASKDLDFLVHIKLFNLYTHNKKHLGRQASSDKNTTVRDGSIEIIIHRKMKTSYSTTHFSKISVNVKMYSIKTKNVLKEKIIGTYLPNALCETAADPSKSKANYSPKKLGCTGDIFAEWLFNEK